MIGKPARLILFFLCALGLGLPAAAEETQYRTYLTDRFEDGIPASESAESFLCWNPIHAVIEVSGAEAGPHSFSVLWLDPSGAIRESTHRDFISGQTSKVWASFRPDDPPGSIIAEALEPGSGMGDLVDWWKAKMSVDGRDVAVHRFRLRC
ncbi:MAG: hypothetical protein F4Z15_00435 [Gammaproteobacteria bacterium]|nr:hypothetical protein [Gammaproteobacteria bacterium]MYJ51082.1 hypothetical protein [Gammaproteobacteria bacterium]